MSNELLKVLGPGSVAEVHTGDRTTIGAIDDGCADRGHVLGQQGPIRAGPRYAGIMDARQALRRELLAMVARRQGAGSGSMLAALDVRRIFMDWWSDVDRALHGVPYAVAGAVATNAYAPERLTRDIDVVVLTAATEQAEVALGNAGWQFVGPLSVVRGTSWRDAAGHELDLIALDEAWASEALQAAQRNRILGMPTLPFPYLVFMKLQAGRTTDLGDVSRMLGRADAEQLDQARHMVRRFGDHDDLADLEQLRRLGLLERQTGRE